MGSLEGSVFDLWKSFENCHLSIVASDILGDVWWFGIMSLFSR
jgi:hypothetical protein